MVFPTKKEQFMSKYIEHTLKTHSLTHTHAHHHTHTFDSLKIRCELRIKEGKSYENSRVSAFIISFISEEYCFA